MTKLPLSGDVSQAINPWSWWIRSMGQIGFINVNTSRAGDPELEQRIVENVASYGRQLGRITEVLQILLGRIDQAGLTAPERTALERFSAMAEEIARVKAESRSPLTLADVDRFIGEMEALRRHDPAAYREASARLARIPGAEPAHEIEPA